MDKTSKLDVEITNTQKNLNAKFATVHARECGDFSRNVYICERVQPNLVEEEAHFLG